MESNFSNEDLVDRGEDGREGDVSADVGKLNIQKCSNMAMDREDVRKLLSRPKFTEIGNARIRRCNQLHGTECCVR